MIDNTMANNTQGNDMDTTNGTPQDTETIMYVDLKTQPEWKVQMLHELIYGNLSVQEKEEIFTAHPRIAKLYIGHQSGEIRFMTNEQSNLFNLPPNSFSNNTNKRSAENDGFKYPSAKLTARKSSTPAKEQQLLINNKYKNLNEVNLSAPSTSNQEQIQDQTPTQPPKPKIRPIQVLRTENYKEILQQLKQDNTNVNFKAANSGLFVKIQPENTEAHRTISAYLENKQIQHYILPTGIVRPIKVVIRGLPIDTTGEEIEQELKDQGFPVIKAVQLISRKNNNKMPL